MLSLKDAHVSYRDFHVLKDVSLSLEQGVFHSLIGPNGAGKTTLISALSGDLRVTRGTVFYEKQDITHWKADKRTRAGIGRSFQKTNLFPTLSAKQNVELAVLGVRRIGFRQVVGRLHGEVEEAALAALESVGLTELSSQTAALLAHGDKRKLELAMLLAQRPRVLLLDEPTAGMSIAEAEQILELIGALRDSGKYAMLLVEHKLEAVMKLSHTVTVLNAGEVLAAGTPEEMMHNADVERAYLGGSHGSIA